MEAYCSGLQPTVVLGSYCNPKLSALMSSSGQQQPAMPAGGADPEPAVGAGTLNSYGS